MKNNFEEESFYVVDWGSELSFVYPDKTEVVSLKMDTEIADNFDELVKKIIGEYYG